jgi:ssDNA-binding Zn-finger/Zn-ribbon topoisomerase 1
LRRLAQAGAIGWSVLGTDAPRENGRTVHKRRAKGTHRSRHWESRCGKCGVTGTFTAAAGVCARCGAIAVRQE